MCIGNWTQLCLWGFLLIRARSQPKHEQWHNIFTITYTCIAVGFHSHSPCIHMHCCGFPFPFPFTVHTHSLLWIPISIPIHHACTFIAVSPQWTWTTVGMRRASSQDVCTSFEVLAEYALGKNLTKCTS